MMTEIVKMTEPRAPMPDQFPRLDKALVLHMDIWEVSLHLKKGAVLLCCLHTYTHSVQQLQQGSALPLELI